MSGDSIVVSPVEYKRHPEFSEYEIGNDGTVWKNIGKRRRGRSGRILRGEMTRICDCNGRDGYRIVRLYLNGSYFSRSIARLVLETFVGPCPAGKEACHGILGRCINSVENLRWDTHINNCSYKISHGTSQRGENHPRHKLKQDEVVKIKERLARGEKVYMLADEFGTCRATISHIKNGRLWAWLTVAPPSPIDRLPPLDAL